MGRQSTGAISTGGALRIELKYLLKKGFIKKNCNIQGTLSWTNGSSISVYSSYTEEEKFLRLVYTISDKTTGEKQKYDYKIELAEVTSNLGKGKVLYFVCPESWNNCRILYKCYGSPKWKCRKAYKTRIYYESQMGSNYDYYNTRYWQIDKQIKKLQEQRKSYSYKGIATKRYLRLQALRESQERFDLLRWTVGVPKRLRGYVQAQGFYP
jgi:hypothetical protein